MPPSLFASCFQNLKGVFGGLRPAERIISLGGGGRADLADLVQVVLEFSFSVSWLGQQSSIDVSV